LSDSRQDRVARLLHFLRKKPYVHFQYFFQRICGVLGVTADGKNLTDDRRISLSVQPNSIQGVDDANNLTESAVERAHARTAGCDEGPVDIKQQQLHAAILS